VTRSTDRVSREADVKADPVGPPSGGGNTVKYRVHRFDLRMTQDQGKLEQFLNGLDGEVVAVVPNVTMHVLWMHRVNFLLVVEKIAT
jgi:hypothetical protein